MIGLRRAIPCVLACVLAPSVASAVVSLQVVVDPPEPAPGQVFQILYGLQVRNDSPVVATPLVLNGLEVLSNPGAPQLPQFGMFGGGAVQMTMSSQVVYVVRAPRAGRYLIQGARAVDPQSQRVVYQHPPVTLVVRATPPGGAQPGVQPGMQPPQQPAFPGFPPGFPSPFPPGMMDPFGQQTPPPEPTDPDAPPTGALTGAIFNPDGFIRYAVDNPTPYVGQQVTLRAWLYVPAYDAACEPDREPGLNGFWSEILVLNRETCARRWIPQNVNGRPMAAGLVRKIALYPTHAGHLEVGPMAMNAEFIMGDGFMGTRRRMAAQSPSLTLEAREPPASIRPAGYVPGLIGPVTVSASLDRTSVSVGETVTLTLEAVGNGYIGSVGLPAPNVPAGIRSHLGGSTSSLDHNPETPRGTLRVSHLMVPERPGSFAFPFLVVPWFDPVGQRFETTQVPIPTLTVTGTALETDRTPRETDPSLELAPLVGAPSLDAHRPVFTTPTRALLAVLFTPFALLLTALARALTSRLRARREADAARLQHDPLALLEQAQKALGAGEFARATSLAGRALDKARREHQSTSLDADTTALVREAQGAADTARFAGESDADAARALVEKVARAIERLEALS